MGAQASFAEGMRAAKEVQKDLQWTQNRVEYVHKHHFSILELIVPTVRSMTEQRASTLNNSDRLSDDTQHQSITRHFTCELALWHC
jgi:regulator of sigma D